MAQAQMTVHVRYRDAMTTRLLIAQLETLASEMRVMASPHAEALTKIVDRYMANFDDEDGESDGSSDGGDA